MTTIAHKMPKGMGIFVLFFLFLSIYSCSTDEQILIDSETETLIEDSEEAEETPTEDTTEPDDNDNSDTEETENDDSGDNDNTDSSDTTDDSSDTAATCTNPSDFIFNEKDGLVLVEFEDADFSGNWKLRSNGNGHTGDGYLVWEGPQYFNDPGNGVISYKINIKNPGTYRFIWHNAIKTGNDATEHNDTWLRFNDATDFFGKKNNSTIYPNGTGKSPNPKGASKNGWFKLFRSGSDLGFKWQSRTSDHDAHEIYVKFNSAGTYLMEVSARSSGHALDKFVLFKTNWSKADATSSTELSVISCD